MPKEICQACRCTNAFSQSMIHQFLFAIFSSPALTCYNSAPSYILLFSIPAPGTSYVCRLVLLVTPNLCSLSQPCPFSEKGWGWSLNQIYHHSPAFPCFSCELLMDSPELGTSVSWHCSREIISKSKVHQARTPHAFTQGSKLVREPENCLESRDSAAS